MIQISNLESEYSYTYTLRAIWFQYIKEVPLANINGPLEVIKIMVDTGDACPI